MTIDQISILFFGGGFLLVFLLVLVNAIYIYRKYYPGISKNIDGETFDGGFLFAASRFMHWGHFCISHRRAEKFGVEKVFSGLSGRARFHLIFHWVGVLLGMVLLLGGWYFMPARG
ncbi:hypothetical protein [Microbulbifer sp. Q7]|uniref:hypothetical protein n=1 Tax=Microbulbifer sp. Q7 TaxID=1785091 RepID=UPI00082B1F0F|nr:hypothetical protein [Microbulbifer sp. Q7]